MKLKLILNYKLGKVEQVKLNLELEINELSIESNGVGSVDITKDQIKSMFAKFKDFVLTRNLLECKKFISDYIKEIIIYRDYVEVIFSVAFSFADNKITHDLYINIYGNKIIQKYF